jgi:hypothetical protein
MAVWVSRWGVAEVDSNEAGTRLWCVVGDVDWLRVVEEVVVDEHAHFGWQSE